MLLYYLITVVPRNRSDDYALFFRKHNIETPLAAYGKGTTVKKTLDLLGLEYNEKQITFSAVCRSEKDMIMSALANEMGINMPGCGIAVTVPFDSVGGAAALSALIGKRDISGQPKENNEMKDYLYSLIVAIAQKGGTDAVMEAARPAGAGGGTVIHVKGTGSELASKFFGVTIAEEKEMILIVVKKNDRDTVMHAIMEKAGVDTETHAVVFSLPVDSVVGLRSVADED